MQWVLAATLVITENAVLLLSCCDNERVPVYV